MEPFDKSEFFMIILNGYTIAQFLAYTVQFGLGAIIHFTFDVRESVKSTSNGTPMKFNFWFMLKDNVPRLIGILVLLYVNIVFFQDIYGVEPNGKLMIALGISWESIVGYASKSGKKGIKPWRESRAKLIEKYR